MEANTLTFLGILFTIFIGSANLYITLKNRSNSLREHIYKEQITLYYKIFKLLTELNSEADMLLNNPSRTDNNFEQKRDNLIAMIFEKQFIMPDELLTKTKNIVNSGTDYYMSYLLKKPMGLTEKYKAYYDDYFSLIQFARTFFGVDSLTQENLNLHKRNNFIKKLERIDVLTMVESVIH